MKLVTMYNVWSPRRLKIRSSKLSKSSSQISRFYVGPKTAKSQELSYLYLLSLNKIDKRAKSKWVATGQEGGQACVAFRIKVATEVGCRSGIKLGFVKRSEFSCAEIATDGSLGSLSDG